MEYLEQYNFDLQYHPGKANAVADALSRKTRCTLACLIHDEWDAIRTFAEFGLELIGSFADGLERVTLSAMFTQPALIDQVVRSQKGNARTEKFIARAHSGESPVWTISYS